MCVQLLPLNDTLKLKHVTPHFLVRNGKHETYGNKVEKYTQIMSHYEP